MADPAKRKLRFVPVRRTRRKVEEAAKLLCEMAKIKRELSGEGIEMFFRGVKDLSEMGVEMEHDVETGEIVVTNVRKGEKQRFEKEERITAVNGK